VDSPGKTPASQLVVLLRLLQEARQQTDQFFALITPESLYQRAITERHRLIFYVGHLEAFDWNLIAHTTCARPSLHRRFEELFAFGIDPIVTQTLQPSAGTASTVLPCDNPEDWPALPELLAYCTAARAAVDSCLAELLAAPTQKGIAQDPDTGPLHMAIEHRLMHLETLAYMLPKLPLASFVPALIASQSSSVTRQPGYARTGLPGSVRMIAIPAGKAALGRPRGAGFGWDNEYEPHVVEVPRFAIDARNVTNGEFAEFVAAGGYKDPSLWHQEDWLWKTASELHHPWSWRMHGQDIYIRTCFAEVPLPVDWPVGVSLAEARAYLRFASKKRGQTLRLPTEAEFHRAAYGVPGEPGAPGRPYPWGDEPPLPLHHGNFGAVSYSTTPVAAFPAGDSAFGVTDLMGNGWEWTQTLFQPFQGFQIDPRYAGYSQPFFDDQHYVLKGASARTHGIFLRSSFRNWFQPHYPYVLSKFRAVAVTEDQKIHREPGGLA
jgi:iron(II)-dependent oxidoreductase